MTNEKILDLFEAWDGLTIRLSMINKLEHCPSKFLAGLNVPAGVQVNDDFYPIAVDSIGNYERLRDAALAYQEQQATEKK